MCACSCSWQVRELILYARGYRTGKHVLRIEHVIVYFRMVYMATPMNPGHWRPVIPKKSVRVQKHITQAVFLENSVFAPLPITNKWF